MKKILLIMITISVTTLCLCACSSHDNPMKKMSPEDSAKLLVSASAHAENKCGVHEVSKGDMYELCIEGQKNSVTCQDIYKEMLIYLHNKNITNLTVNDLEDKDYWVSIKPTYDRIRFDTI